jgi:hypothetical protein
MYLEEGGRMNTRSDRAFAMLTTNAAGRAAQSGGTRPSLPRSHGFAKAAVYLCDRILGRTTGPKVARADDREAPYTEEAFQLDLEDKEEDNDLRRMFARSEAKLGA